MSCIINNRRFSRLKLICFTIGLMGVFLSATGQTNPKQALVRYQLAQQYLPGYDSLRWDLENEIHLSDSILTGMEKKLQMAIQRSMVCVAGGFSAERNRMQEDSLALLQQEMIDMEKTLSLIITRKQISHEEILMKSFQQQSLEFGKARSRDLLLEAEPLYSREPIIDLTDEFILFIETSRQKKQ